MKKVFVFLLGAALVLGMSGAAMALDLPEGFDLNIDINADLSLGGVSFTAISEGALSQAASANVNGLLSSITKNEGRVISTLDLPNLDIDQVNVPLGKVETILGATAILEQSTEVVAQNTDFVLSQNEGFVLSTVSVEGPISISNVNFQGYPWDYDNGFGLDDISLP